MVIIFQSFISNWLKDILVLFITISFLEILLPKGRMKKLVHFIEGLLIIFVIISPFSSLNQFRFDIDMQVEDFMNTSVNQNILNDQEERIRSTFINNLSQEVKKIIESNSIYRVSDVNISMREDGEENILLLDEVFVRIESDDKPQGGIKIDKIQINDSNHSVLVNYENQHDNLKDLLSQYLGIDKKSIYIEEEK